MAYLEGRLRENIVSPENEHTGYVLEIEVDISALQDPEELVNERGGRYRGPRIHRLFRTGQDPRL